MQPPGNLDRQRGTKVERPSPTRKLMHLATALVPAAGWWVSYWLALALAAALLAASLVVEAVRHWWPGLNRLLWYLLPTTFRAGEERQILGSTWLSLGMLATFLLFGCDIGGTAILFLAWGDPAAELVGRRWGRASQDKTLAGSLGCLSVCLVAGLVGIGWGGLSGWAVVGGALVATLVERWSPPPDDNVWMPVLSGTAMATIEWLSGGQTELLPLWR